LSKAVLRLRVKVKLGLKRPLVKRLARKSHFIRMALS
jgi:hypothetical protein